jgi:MoaA/NifB/PqqE/SkfB family radical SAM enzyme
MTTHVPMQEAHSETFSSGLSLLRGNEVENHDGRETMMARSATTDPPAIPLNLLWMEITGRCQLGCVHCYAGSGPSGTHGAMTTAEWLRVIEQASELRTRHVQFIGGEPTLHPDLPTMVHHALEHGIGVEVYTNMVRVTNGLWQVFSHPGVRLATSYYSSEPAEHDAITGRRRSHERTRSNIHRAVARGIPVRVGMTRVHDGQHIDGAIAELHALGVEEVTVDRLRQVGRGVRDQRPGLEQLCGHCARGNAAVSPAGDVWPCVFSRWLVLGNVRRQSLSTILASPRAEGVRASIAGSFAGGSGERCPPTDDGSPCQNPLCPPHLRPKGWQR